MNFLFLTFLLISSLSAWADVYLVNQGDVISREGFNSLISAVNDIEQNYVSTDEVVVLKSQYTTNTNIANNQALIVNVLDGTSKSFLLNSQDIAGANSIITLAAGKYFIDAYFTTATASTNNTSSVTIYNNTSNTLLGRGTTTPSVLEGTSERNPLYSHASVKVELAIDTDLQLRQAGGTTTAISGFPTLVIKIQKLK